MKKPERKKRFSIKSPYPAKRTREILGFKSQKEVEGFTNHMEYLLRKRRACEVSLVVLNKEESKKLDKLYRRLKPKLDAWAQKKRQKKPRKRFLHSDRNV